MNTTDHIRIFISSTFKDMQDERDIFVQKVFPRLREEAERKGIELSYVDLRWGVAIGTPDAEVISTCLMAIEDCCPFFIGFVGYSYGTWTPSVAWYRRKELEKRFNGVKSSLLQKKSLTEIEMRYYLVYSVNTQNSYFYFREEENSVPSVMESFTRSGLFVRKIRMFIRKILKKRSPAILLENLKLFILSNYTNKPRIYPGDTSFANSTGLECLLNNDFNALLEKLFAPFSKKRSDSVRYRQECFVEMTKSYIEMSNVFVEIEKWMSQRAPKGKKCADYFLLYGESGIGKTTVLAQMLKNKYEGVKFIYHFVGKSKKRETPIVILCDLISQISYISQREEPVYVGNESIEELSIILRTYIESYGKDVVIIIDDIDAIECDQETKISVMSWLPNGLEHLKYIISSDNIMYDNNNISPQWARMEKYKMKQLSKVEIKEFAKKYILEKYHKNTHRVLNLNTINEKSFLNNLWNLKVFLDEVAISGSFGIELQEEMISLSRDRNSLLNTILNRLKSLCDFEIARGMLVSLSLMKYGLHENDLLELFPLENKHIIGITWSVIYCNIKPFFISSGYIKLHPEFKDYILKEYVDNEKILRINMARKMEKLLEKEIAYSFEIAYQYAQVDDVVNLKRVLSLKSVFIFFYENEKDLLFEYLILLKRNNQIKRLVLELYNGAINMTIHEQLKLYDIISIVFSKTIPAYEIAIDAVNKFIMLQEKMKELDVLGLESLLYAYLRGIDLHSKVCRFQESNALLQEYWSIDRQKLSTEKIREFKALGLMAQGDIYDKQPTIKQRIKAIPYYSEALSNIDKIKFPLKYVELLHHQVDLEQYLKPDSLHLHIKKMGSLVSSSFIKWTHAYFKAIYWTLDSEWISMRVQGTSSDLLQYLDLYLKRLFEQIEAIKRIYGNSCRDLCCYYLHTATVYENIANVYSSKNNYKKKVDNLNMSLSYFEKYYVITTSCYDEFTEEYANAIHSIAFAYQNLLESRPLEKESITEKCLSWYSHEERVLRELFPDGHWTLAKLYHNVADVYTERGEFDTAKEYIEKAIETKRLHIKESDKSLYKSYIRRLHIYKAELLEYDIFDKEKILEFEKYILDLLTMTNEMIDLSDEEKEKRRRDIEKYQMWLDNWENKVDVCRLKYAKDIIEVAKKMITDYRIRLKYDKANIEKLKKPLNAQWVKYCSYVKRHHLESALESDEDKLVKNYIHFYLDENQTDYSLQNCIHEFLIDRDIDNLLAMLESSRNS